MTEKGRLYQLNGEPAKRRMEFEDRKPQICGYCLIDGREGCIYECQPQRDYHLWQPVPLEEIWDLPKLPPVKETLHWSKEEKWVFSYMLLVYLRELAINDSRG